MAASQTTKRKWVELWEYIWSYKIRLNEFSIYKHYFRYNGKKRKHSRLKNELVHRSVPQFEVPVFEKQVEKSYYDWGAWSVSERESTTLVIVKDYDKAELINLFKEITKHLPSPPLKP